MTKVSNNNTIQSHDTMVAEDSNHRKLVIKRGSESKGINYYYRLFCWGTLFHMLGFENESSRFLKQLTELQDKRLKSKLKDLIDLADSTLKYQKSMNDRGDLLLEIVRLTSEVLATENLSIECPRNEVKSKGNDRKDRGYSRDPFKSIVNKTYFDKLPVASVCYLLRGHSLFFCRPQVHRSFNAAKVALNDFYQTHQLAWRLYENSESCHRESESGSTSEYFDAVRSGPNFLEQPGKSHYFIWSILTLCEVFRGNIYRQIDYMDESARYYRHVNKRFEVLVRDSMLAHPKNLFCIDDDNLDPKNPKWFITPTLIKALFERSKILFDMGQLLESLLVQLKCLLLITRMYEKDHKVTQKRVEQLNVIREICNFIESERVFPMFDRELIWSYFLELQGNYSGLILSDLVKFIPAHMGQLTAEILARMGYTLYILRPRMLLRRPWRKKEIKEHFADRSRQEELLSQYFQFHDIWSRNKPSKIKASDLGNYNQTLLQSEYPSTGGDFLSEKLDYSLSQFVRQRTISNTSINCKELNKMEFYNSILTSITENISDLVAVPRKNRKILMRSGYKDRRGSGDLSQDTVYNGVLAALGKLEIKKSGQTKSKFVVLRRWQSFNPKIPRPSNRKLRGGGYFLLWNGKGLVIDPGFDFIQNFYDEGFSLSDIDAVIITHSHPDHDDDFSNITTLIKEWNDYHRSIGQKIRIKYLDLFLNESAAKKFASWLQAADVRIGRIINLPTLTWNKDTQDWQRGPFRGNNVILDLINEYSMKLEIIPAWHDDVIGKTASVGLKFHLFDISKSKSKKKYPKPVAVVGYTGDTGAYGVNLAGRGEGNKTCRITEHYRDCDVLVAHLGDIRLRELASIISLEEKYTWHNMDNPHPLLSLLRNWFKSVTSDDFADKTLEFLHMLISLNLVPAKALEAKIQCRGKYKDNEWLGERREIQDWLGEYTLNHGKLNDSSRLQEGYETTLIKAFESMKLPISSELNEEIHRQFKTAQNEYSVGLDTDNDFDITSYVLLEFLCICSLIPWKYNFHLGILGIYELFENMRKHWVDKSVTGRIFVVGELPEELFSSRHTVACWLNMVEGNIPTQKVRGIRQVRKRHVHALTGDIGLHIALDPLVKSDSRLKPQIRCAYCNHNNEILCQHLDYHDPDKIVETPIKRNNSTMIYLCTDKDHHPEDEDKPRHFLNRPELRII